ncbi:MAG: PRC-barrel domain containing protein [Verrucomicrobiaceae bacterium]|nr:MAG: PRC-barrel domain containing protein [Verrucomicrobiaceae bacterium]
MLHNLAALQGYHLAASDGEIGKVRDVYFDDHTWTVRYLIVGAGSWLTGRDVLISPRSLGTIHLHSRTIGVRLTQEQVRNSPPIETAQPISRHYEMEFHQYYGWDPYWMNAAGVPGLWPPFPPAVIPPVTDAGQPLDKSERDPHLRSVEEVSGYGIHAQDGEVGHVTDFIADDVAWRIRYMAVTTGILMFGRTVLLSPEWIEKISFDRKEVFVNLAQSLIKDAPEYDAGAPITREFEESLHRHYDRQAYWHEAPPAT